MPVQKCQSGNKPGKKYGKHGKCYTGSDAESKAKKQGQAIEISRHKNKP